jgi:hypothetical protein
LSLSLSFLSYATAGSREWVDIGFLLSGYQKFMAKNGMRQGNDENCFASVHGHTPPVPCKGAAETTWIVLFLLPETVKTQGDMVP